MIKLATTFVTLVLLTSVANAQRGCTMTPYGKGCGPLLTGTVQPNGGTVRVTLSLSKAQPNTVVIMAIGDNRLDLPAYGAGIGCRWLLNPVFIQFHQTNNLGSYSHSRAVSSTFVGTYHAQFVVLGGTVLTTNGISFQCK